MNTIKSIETIYKGYRFRSRLEARWAVFFDALKIRWEYEKEGYALSSGYYLPDFFLPSPMNEYPSAGYWVEIKGLPATYKEKLLLDELCRSTKHTSFLMQGLPSEHRVYHVHHSFIRGEYLDLGWGGENLNAWFGLNCLVTRFAHADMVDLASERACSARFEHGEQG